MTPHRLLHTAALAAVAGLALGAAGCSGSDGSNAATTTAAGAADTAEPGDAGDQAVTGASPAAIETYEVGRASMTLVDDSRPTKAHGGEPERPDRTLPIEVWYPEDVDGPVPLVVFSHGSTRRAVHYERTLEAWASAGYVVVGPDFPLSKEGTPGGTDYGGIAEQAGDVSFVIDQVLDLAGDPDQPWAALVDGERIGLGGQSFGAITTVATAVNPCCADPRISAVTEFAGAWFDLGEDGPIPAADAPPALLVHGDADPTVPYALGTALYDLYPGEVQLLTLPGSGHDPGFFGGLGEPLDALVTRATLAFYDAHLKDDPTAEDRLAGLVADAGPDVARLGPPAT